MLDLKFVRENPEETFRLLQFRIKDDAVIHNLIRADNNHRRLLQELQSALAERNTLSREYGTLAQRNGSVDVLQPRIRELISIITGLQALVKEEAATVDYLLARIPNIVTEDTPIGPDETGNVELYQSGIKPEFDFIPKEHYELGSPFGMDFESASKMSGSRFVVLKGIMARLERAIGQFMLDYHTEHSGYTEVAPPLLVHKDTMFGTGQLPKFKDDLFRTTDGLYLIPTAEVPLTNLLKDTISDWDKIHRFCALTPCFRAEAGAAGRDSRGMIRQHQFNKVELVSVLSEDAMNMQEETEFERMLNSVVNMLLDLELHFRVVHLCSGDIGFSARKTYDIEVWFPGQNTYREISSISYFGDFQARRMSARHKTKEGKGTKFLHTFNGSGVAVGRALAAILENNQNEDGSINVPAVLRPYLKGQAKIEVA